jgi:hypothetical protein
MLYINEIKDLVHGIGVTEGFFCAKDHCWSCHVFGTVFIKLAPTFKSIVVCFRKAVFVLFK